MFLFFVPIFFGDFVKIEERNRTLDAPDTIATNIRISKKLLDAVAERAGKRGVSKFFRDAAAEKLARDFGVLVAPTLSRVGQGKRTDLADNPKKIEQLREQAAMMREKRWKKE